MKQYAPLCIASSVAVRRTRCRAGFESSAQTSYPDRVVRIILPTPPGGGGDTLGRLLSQRLSERWGRQVVMRRKETTPRWRDKFYRPRNTGARFSMNAFTPSLWSSVSRQMLCVNVSNSSAARKSACSAC